jgi:hypothetical protein
MAALRQLGLAHSFYWAVRCVRPGQAALARREPAQAQAYYQYVPRCHCLVTVAA